MTDEVPEQYRPRLCHVVKWDDFPGYGFNLHAEKGKAGQYIGKVDDNSPAQAAGLKEGDRIVEVNGTNIGNENHQQVVTRIKSGGDETNLLVVDEETDKYYRENKKIIRGDLPEVRFISARRESKEFKDEPTEDNHYQQEEPESSAPEPEAEVNATSSVSSGVHNGNGISEDYSYRPRLCHLKIWAHFQGYGFNLHAEKDKPGQYIGLVDNDSPASSGGLKIHDRIIEVNGVNVEMEPHTNVIARIKAIPLETKLLVCDKETDAYYKKKGVTVSSSMPQTEYIVTPDATGAVNGLNSSAPQSAASHLEHEFTVAAPTRQISTDSSGSASAHSSGSASAPPSKDTDGLELNLSVAEMKERLKAKKRQDPRMNKVPFEQKYKEFQRM